MPAMHPDQSILKEAHGLVYGERKDAYGHPYDDYVCTAALMTAILRTGGVIAPDKAISAYQAVLMMAAVKLSRASRIHKRDNLVDLAGYAACAEEIYLASVGTE